MFLKRFVKYAENLFYLTIIRTCSFIFRFSSKSGIYRIARKIAFLMFIFDGRHRRTALEGLSHAFKGSLDRRQVKALALESFRSMVKSGAEMGFFVGKPGSIRESVVIEGEENLRAALARGKGVILVSAHFGNFPLLIARLSIEGYPTSVIMRPLKTRGIENIFLPETCRLGVTPIYSIPRAACVAQTLKTLRRNGIVFIPVDQNFGSGGIYVDFFGRKAATATGPIVFAERTGAAIVPCFIIRNNDNNHTLRIEPQIPLQRSEDYQAYLHDSLQRITSIIEDYIRRYPQDWTWIHRRWKSRPKAQY
ncbi:MAG: lysophospholipid acyltransferase family protein [Deltaproteobacteria bacterium]